MIGRKRRDTADGYLVLVRRLFDNEPVRLFATRVAAVTFARAAGTTDTADRPARGVGELGPPGLLSRVTSIGIVPFTDGIPGEYEPINPPVSARK